MSSKFFDFNVPDTETLPDGLSNHSGADGSRMSIKDNMLFGLYEASNWKCKAVSDVGDTNGVVKARVQPIVTGQSWNRETVGLTLRTDKHYNSIGVVITDEGMVGVSISEVNKDAVSLASGYAIPNFDPDAFYLIEAHMRGEDIEVIVDGVSVYEVTTDKYLGVTKHGVLTGPGGYVDDFYIGDATTLPVKNNAPVLTVSHDPVTKVDVNTEVPEITYTATDVEDGDITHLVTVKGDPVDITVSGVYEFEYEIRDSDFNTVRVQRTVEVVSKPVIEYHGRPSYTIVQGQPWKPPLGYFIEESGIRGSIYPQGWTDGNRNVIGSYTLSYQHYDVNGNPSDLIAATVDVIERPEITDTGPFSMVQEYGEEYITVDGYTLKRFDSPDGESWSYGFEDDVTVHPVDILKISNETTNTIQVARIPIPFDSLARCTSTTISIDIQTDNFIDGSRVEVSFGEYRSAAKYRIKKNAQSQRTVMEFEIKPFHDSSFRVYGLGNGKDPDSVFQDYNTHDWHLSTDTDIIVYFRFGNTAPAANILAINATARVGKCYLFADGEHFAHGKDSFNVTPFRPDDHLNKMLPKNVVTRASAITDDKTDINATHFQVVAGSEWVQVADVSEVEIGDILGIGYVSHITANDNLLASHRERGVRSITTRNVLGYAQYVEEIDYAGNRIRMSYPALQDYSSSDFGIDWRDKYECIFTASPEVTSMVHGPDSDAWRISPTSGVDKRDTANSNYTSKTVVYELENYDPLQKFKFDYLLPQNNFTSPLEGEDFESASYGERLINGEFEMPLPAEFDGNISNFWNGDTNYIYILPNKTYALHTYLTRPENENGVVTCSRLTGHDLTQWSISQVLWRPDDSPNGRTNGPRASGLSGASMIRQEEMDKITCRGFTEADVDADLDVAENAIQHAIAGYLSSAQFQSPDFRADITDPDTKTNYFIHAPYNQPVKLVNGGSGYARGDVVELTCSNRADTHTPTYYAIEAVSETGEIQKAFTTRTGQHKADPSSATHSPYKTSGVGTGAVFDTTGMFTQNHSPFNCTAYPSSMADSHFTTIYGGAIPNGGVMTIDPKINLREDWKAAILKAIDETGKIPDSLCYEFYAICAAIKKYGFNPCDASNNTFAPLFLDHRITETSASGRLLDKPDGVFAYNNSARLRGMLTPVHNFTPAHHLETDQDLAPVLEIIAGDDITVPPNWRDPKCFALSPLYGDLSDQVTVDREFDFTTLEPQEFYYSVTDKDGRTSTIGPRRVVVDIPQPIAEAGPSFSLKAGEPFKLQGYGAPSIDIIGIDFIEWRQIEGAPTALSDANIGDPTGVTPSAIRPQTLVYELRVVDENGLEATDTMSIEVAALEGRSSVDLSLPDAPDGVFWTVLTDSANRVIFSDALEFVNGVATAEQLPVDGGELIRGTVDSGNTVESPGTGVKGVTYAV